MCWGNRGTGQRYCRKKSRLVIIASITLLLADIIEL